jgi:CheY-like chemotaxis protein/HPt (histidine-containing phosphotransfer) domain-containing protein
MLVNWGMLPESSGGAVEALSTLRTASAAVRPFRLVLTDCNMPDIDGFALASRIKQDATISSTIIMMLTSGSRAGDVARCEQMGIAAHLLKPVKQSELFDAIVLALGVSAAEDEVPRPVHSAPPAALRPLKVLLAEDSLVNQKLAVGLLERQGHAVVVVTNGKQALAAATSEPFDLVLMDVQMPEMDGLEATAEIRRHEERHGGHVPIIAMTAHAMKGDRERCLAAGMDDYVAKPIRAQQLFERIATAVGGAAPLRTLPEKTPAGSVDWQQALAAVGGDEELLRDVIKTFLDETPGQLKSIAQAIESGDAAVVGRGAHTVRGALRFLGAESAVSKAQALEEASRDLRPIEARQLLAQLAGEMEQFRPVLVAFARGDGMLNGG